ncbi:hypothetical protein B0H14DRAFT_2814010 [Mycena olivaceomarginata]|nr:hypothetical protein B0H14DRAFT_2814010 [Mycena olivaceomarginata]
MPVLAAHVAAGERGGPPPLRRGRAVARRGPGLRDGRERGVCVTTARERHDLGRSGRAGFVIRWVSVPSFSVHPHNTVPRVHRARSVPAGASHRLRVWLKTRRDDLGAGALDDSYVYQRVWKSDAFKIGARLDFEALGPRIVMGSPARVPQTVMMEAVGFWSTA